MKSKLARTYKLSPEVIAQIESRAKQLNIGYAEYISLLVKTKGSQISSPAEAFGQIAESLMGKRDGEALGHNIEAGVRHLDEALAQIHDLLSNHIATTPGINELTQAMLQWHHKVDALEGKVQQQAELVSELRLQLFKCKYLATRTLTDAECRSLKLANDRLTYLEENIASWHEQFPWDAYFREQRVSQQIAGALMKQEGGRS